MKERTTVSILITLLGFAAVLGSGNTDAIFIALGVAFFALCIAYAEGCEKL